MAGTCPAPPRRACVGHSDGRSVLDRGEHEVGGTAPVLDDLEVASVPRAVTEGAEYLFNAARGASCEIRIERVGLAQLRR